MQTFDHLDLWRPAAGRHNIAEIALHHAYFVRSVRAQLSTAPAEPVVAEGEDWFDVSDEHRLSWSAIYTTLEAEQDRLRATLEDIEAARTTPAMTPDERFALVLGITCHAVYHAGRCANTVRIFMPSPADCYAVLVNSRATPELHNDIGTA